MGTKRTHKEVDVTAVTTNPSVAVASFFNGFRPSEDATFELYKTKAADSYVLHGENQKLEYEGRVDNNKGYQYMLGVYDPSSKSIELYQAPVLPTSVISKSKKRLAGKDIKQADARASTMRTALGQAFGTKKAKKAIADLERNRIDSDKLVGSVVDIVGSVRAAAKDLPTQQEMAATISEDRPIPPPNVDATDVEQIYPVRSIIPQHEWNFIRVGPIMKEKDAQQRLQMLPYTKSAYITKKLPTLTQSVQMEKLQLLYYLSLLLGVYNNRRVSNKENLLEKLNSPADTLVDGILERFTVVRPGQFGRSKDRSFAIDPQREDKLLCYILALIMHLDNFIVEISPFAHELGLKPSKLVNLLRTMGATVKGATVAQAQAFGIPKSAASTYKIATLKVPFKLPELNKRGKAARR
ncbi:AFR638Cp [Eremothecium gossypii ATCC 10895]|uniref:AFR638Cp n=1 Tax=Eremothecium gossypii (strain ATCC 10895 / CBS 109.51 / FGSC 9923 / NRRL Y-1056) TaxID=284811 RepID=Q752D8_EREGS|nr:AFR638Cp [Eremothecium gossypii ATCC 10895]AAS54009.1 AFR638Cp [Eremothecium gossypii ATCC 10895]AEY98323.1 FAFR638Cp [Eremothecium gossypii FDAG1]